MVPYIFTNYVLSRKKPFLASFKLTYRCNLSCQQCPFFFMKAPELTYESACSVINRLYDRGSRLLVFEGGEPLLWRDGKRRIHDLVTYAKNRFYSVGVTTNGTIRLDVPSDVLWVSIDGLRDTHNALRNASIFDQVIKNVKASTHPRLFAHVTVNSVNADEIPALLVYLDGIFRGITLQFYYPYNHKDSLFLDFDRREQLLSKIVQLKHSGIHVLNSIPALRALERNHWTCRDYLLDNANPDESIQQGCYLKGRTDIDCSLCGFSPHTEISLASFGNLRAIISGMKVFL